jgi:hypothetical protein
MHTKKKPKKKRMKSKRTTVGKMATTKKAAKKKLAKKNDARKSSAAKAKSVGGKKTAAKVVGARKAPARERNLTTSRAFPQEGPGAHSGEQSGDQQGISRIESADSESVDELLEEGNAFEADVVAGVENAEAADEREVRTHEVPEDDVPDEYLDKE